jgi:hypothetical protein
MSDSAGLKVRRSVVLFTMLFVSLACQELASPQQALAQTAAQPAAAPAPTPAAAPPPTQEQQRLWAERDTAANRQRWSRTLLQMLATDEFTNRLSPLSRRPELAQISKLMAEDKPEQAADVFTGYFFNKLRFPWPYGISASNLSPYARGLCDQGLWPMAPLDPRADPAKVIEAAEKLMNNVIAFGAADVNIGAPGSVNWCHPHADIEQMVAEGRTKSLNLNLASGAALTPLVHAFVITHDRKYLNKWIDFIDDWSVNAAYFDRVHPCIVPDSVTGTAQLGLMQMLRTLTGITHALPANERPMPTRVLAQLLKRRVVDMSPYSVAYIRSNTHNWTHGAQMMLNAIILDEFRIAPQYFRECRRRNIEDNSATQSLRDGSENQQDPWYNTTVMESSAALSLMRERESVPGWNELPWINAIRADVDWKNELRQHLKDRTTFLIHLRTPQDDLPPTFSGGTPRKSDRGSPYFSPDAFNEPQNLAILAAIDRPTEGIRPSFHSEWYPYGGFNMVRQGWEKQSGWGAMFCSPQPGAYGGFRSRSNNNSLSIGAFGQDLLADDGLGHYMYPSSPIRVDGKNQFFHAGLYKVPAPAAHKVFQVSAWTEPADWRWHASDKFNLMEGIYAGPFGNEADAKSVDGAYGKDESMSGMLPLSATIQGVTHQRLAMYCRQAALWIITDRLSAKSEHTFEQVWFLPTSPGGVAFTPEKIVLDERNNRIETGDTIVESGGQKIAKANLSMQQFTAAKLSYKRSNVARKPVYGRLFNYGWEQITGSWKGSGEQQIVTALFPRAPVNAGADAGAAMRAGDLRSITAISSGRAAKGFTAVTPDGLTVSYLASPSASDTLQIGQVRVEAEALLLCGESGLALGCKTMSVGSAAVVTNTAPEDFEFTLSPAGTVARTPIYRPISPVIIGPERNVFADWVDVTMTTPTQGVEVRYTTDGSEPTPRSARYEGPVRLERSAIVKARAYRPGLAENPPHQSGTHATAVSTAVFDRAPRLTPGVSVAKATQGLFCRYFEGDWRSLWFDGDRLRPQAVAPVPALWDMNVIPASNPPVGDRVTPRAKAYTVEYVGFLNVPQDGVYTLHAPRENVWPDVEAGYDLRVILGNQYGSGAMSERIVGLNEWYPSTRLHALGNWSVALKKGPHPLRIRWVDYRTDAAKQLNREGIREYVWTGIAPDLRISGPGIDKQPIPAAWLLRDESAAKMLAEPWSR